MMLKILRRKPKAPMTPGQRYKNDLANLFGCGMMAMLAVCRRGRCDPISHRRRPSHRCRSGGSRFDHVAGVSGSGYHRLHRPSLRGSTRIPSDQERSDGARAS